MSIALSLESLLTLPTGFGLTTATPCQRAKCRILTGVALGALAHDPDVIAMVGGVDRIAELPVGAPPAEVHDLAAIRTAKSLTAAARVIHLSQTVDVSGLKVGDIVRIGIVSIKLGNAKAVMSHVTQNVLARPILKELLIGEPNSERIVLRHPSGHPIEVVPLPLDRAGGAAVSTFLAGIICDEEPRMIGEDDGVKNWDHLRSAALGRILPGGQMLGIGSPWAALGPVYDLFTENFGKRQSRDLVVLRATGPMLNPVWWTPKRCADLQRRDPTAYRTDVLGEFADPESGLFSSEEIGRATRESLVLSARDDVRYFAAIDAAFRGNDFTLAVAHAEGPRTVVDGVWSWSGTRADPLVPSYVLGEIAKITKPYRVTVLHGDSYQADTLRDLARGHGLELVEQSMAADHNVARYMHLKTLFQSERAIEIPNEPVLVADLRAIRKRIVSNGIRIVLPHTSDGRHCDLAASLVLAVYLARRPAAAPPTFAGIPRFVGSGLSIDGGIGITGPADAAYATRWRGATTSKTNGGNGFGR